MAKGEDVRLAIGGQLRIQPRLVDAAAVGILIQGDDEDVAVGE